MSNKTSRVINLLVVPYEPYVKPCTVDWEPDPFRIRTKDCYPGAATVLITRAIIGMGLIPKFHMYPTYYDVDFEANITAESVAGLMCHNESEYDMLTDGIDKNYIGEGCNYIDMLISDRIMFVYKAEPTIDADLLFSIFDWKVWISLALAVTLCYAGLYKPKMHRIALGAFTASMFITTVILPTYSNFLTLALYRPTAKKLNAMEELLNKLERGECTGIYSVVEDQPEWFIHGDTHNFPALDPLIAVKMQSVAKKNRPVFESSSEMMIKSVQFSQKCMIGVLYEGERMRYEALADCHRCNDVTFLTDDRIPTTSYSLQVRPNFPWTQFMETKLQIVSPSDVYKQVLNEDAFEDKKTCHDKVSHYTKPTKLRSSNKSPLNIRQLSDIFFLLILLLILCILVLFFEFFHYLLSIKL